MKFTKKIFWGSPSDVMTNILDGYIIVSELELHSR